MKNLKSEMVKRIGPAAEKFEGWLTFKQSKMSDGKTYVTARYPADYECRRKGYSAHAAGLTLEDWNNLRAAIKASGGETHYTNTAEWIIA
jgi:hypothetical protein